MLEEFMSIQNGNYDNKGDMFCKLAKKVEIKPKEDDKRPFNILLIKIIKQCERGETFCPS